MSDVTVCALYRFVTLENYRELKSPLLSVLQAQGIRGTVLLAKEGINGTVAGTGAAIDHLLAWLKSDPRLAALTHKESYDAVMPFYRTKVKLKNEIVTMGVEGIDPRRVAGTYVKPADWNALIARPDVTLIDTRNDYEVSVGTFQRAINPHTTSFREFPDYVKGNLDPVKHKKVAMFCTGGIRCEKSTAYLKEQGFEEVYHLEGGILQYLEDVPPEKSLWQGECFVFDNRVTVNHDLQKGNYDQCHACRLPITVEDKASVHYQPGISCPYCHDNKSSEQKQRFAQRQKQIQLARARGETHLGSEAIEAAQQRRILKLEAKAAQRETDRGTPN